MEKYQRYYQAVSYLENLSNLKQQQDYMNDHRRPEIFLKRMREFLRLLNNPDRNLNFIHLTGTAGKGTVAIMLQEILLASGQKVGSFTSPFATTSIEKIRINNNYISPHKFADLVEELKPIIDQAYSQSRYGGPSYFEIFLALALLYFKREKCDWIILEAGAGGSYDATNVIVKPKITAITNIHLDHTQILGNTLKQIATDKAGIIKKNSTFFTTEKRPALQKIFQYQCRKKKSRYNLIAAGNNYQSANEALAQAIAGHLGLDNQAIHAGIKRTKLPCRFEVMQKNPLVILDGAHNEIKMKSTVSNLQNTKYRKLLLVVALAANKKAKAILNSVVPLADEIIITHFEITQRKSFHPQKLNELVKGLKRKQTKSTIMLDPNQAMQRALKKASKKDLILATGSFFLTGALRKHWYTESYILKNRTSFR
ncbi:bifunctional folylpolyglutamate synthase/dihydrofolate synthase [Patescibacteria group bacterium]